MYLRIGLTEIYQNRFTSRPM